METFQTPRSSFLTWIEILSRPLAVGRISRYTPQECLEYVGSVLLKLHTRLRIPWRLLRFVL